MNKVIIRQGLSSRPTGNIFRELGENCPRLKYVLVLCVMTISLMSCKPSEFKSAEELSHYVKSPENNLTHRSEHNGLEITVSYKPADLMIYQELGDSPADYTRLSNLQKKYSGYYFFILSFSSTNSTYSAAGSLNEKVRNLSYNIDDFVSLTTPSLDTIYVGEFTPSRPLTAGKATDMIIVFKKDKSKGQEWVQFNLNEFGLGVGDQQFKFSIDDLEHIPHLKFPVVS